MLVKVKNYSIQFDTPYYFIETDKIMKVSSLPGEENRTILDMVNGDIIDIEYNINDFVEMINRINSGNQ